MDVYDKDDLSDLGSMTDNYQFDEPGMFSPGKGKMTPRKELVAGNYIVEDGNVLRYSEETKDILHPRLADYLKDKDNKFRKVSDIQRYFRKYKYDLSAEDVKEMLRAVCGVSILRATGW